MNAAPHPPTWASWLLTQLHPDDTLEEVEGDLDELYMYWYGRAGKTQATLRYLFNVVSVLPPFVRRRKRHKDEYQPSSLHPVMLRNYLKIAWRNLSKQKAYSAINIIGLATGMAVALLIGLWINDELSFNTYHKNYDNIAQIWAGSTDPETSVLDGSVSVQYPVASTLRNNYQHYFKQVLMAWWITDYTLSVGDTKFTKTGEFIDAGALDMLSLTMLKGSYASLADPHSIVLSKSTAEAIFGNEDPIGKTLKVDNRMEVQITGVYEDIPRNNHFSEVDFFSPWALWVSSNPWIKQAENNWDNRSFNIYVQLQPHTTVDEANAAIHDFYFKNSPKNFLAEFEKYKAFAQVIPMSKWHLYSEFENGKPVSGRITFVWLFGIAGAFVLLLACINFINLSTARASTRAKETGVRKAIGSLKAQLVGQFLSESFVVVLFAFVLSAILVLLSLSRFNELADKAITVPVHNPFFWAIILAFLVFTGFMAGLYPAFYLSSFQPAKVLKGAIGSGRLAALPRKVLVVVQFSVSVVLIIGTLVVYRQIQHARNRPVGYNRAGLLSIRMTDPSFLGKYDVVHNELLNTGLVDETAFADNPLTMAWNNYGGYEWQGKNPNMDSDFTLCYVSDTYGKTVKWKLVEGRDFNKNLASDSSAIIVNESAVSYMNLKNPVGEYIRDKNGAKLKIIGVVNNLIMQSPYEPVKQTIFTWNRYASSNIIIKIKNNAPVTKAVDRIESIFKRLVPTAGFDYQFVDEAYSKKFSQEERIGKLAGLFAVLAIFISALGLFGLASFVAEQRRKEIGVRKVLGASVLNVWLLLSKDFVVLVGLSFFIAAPIAYISMHSWLQKYTYHTDIPWWVFGLVGAGVVLITLLTVGFQSIKAALMNPVKSLRSE